MKAKRHITSRFPASQLPREVIGSIDPSHAVKVIVEDSVAPKAPPSLARFFGAAKDRSTSIEAAVERVRQLRDEWD